MSTSTTWRKSSRSGAGSNACVELASTLDALRDSKNPGGSVLRGDLGAFLAEVKRGRFDR